MNDSLSPPAPSRAAAPTRVRYLVLAAVCVITVISYVQRNSISGAETTIRADLALSSGASGAAQGAFFLTYALCQVPSGWLAQRWGGRAALALFAAGWSVVMGLSAAARGLPDLLAAQWVMGALQAGIFPCCTMILAAWYPATRRGFTSALLNSCMLSGSVVASLVTGKLIGPLGWRWLFVLYAVPGVAWAAWFAGWFRNRPGDHPRVNDAERALIGGRPAADEAEDVRELARQASRPAVPWRAIFFSAALWLICLQQFCRSGALRFFDRWLPTYLQEVRGQSVEYANYWTSLPALAGIVGGPVGGVLSDFVLRRTGSRRAARQGIAIGSTLLGLLVYVLAYRVPDTGGAVLLASAGLFIFTFSSPVAYALSMDMGGRNLAVIFATMNMAGNLGSWAFSTYVPYFVEIGGWGAALLVFAAMHVVAVVLWLFINPNGTIGEPADADPARE